MTLPDRSSNDRRGARRERHGSLEREGWKSGRIPFAQTKKIFPASDAGYSTGLSFPGMLIKRILCGEDAILNNVDQSEAELARLGGVAGGRRRGRHVRSVLPPLAAHQRKLSLYYAPP